MYAIVVLRGQSEQQEADVSAKLQRFVRSEPEHFPKVYVASRSLVLIALEVGPGKQRWLIALAQFLEQEGDGCEFMVARNHVGWLPAVRPVVSPAKLRAVVNFGD